MTEPAWCWCCARWGLSVAAVKEDQGGGWICLRCQNSSPSACEKRHMAEALKAGAG